MMMMLLLLLRAVVVGLAAAGLLPRHATFLLAGRGSQGSINKNRLGWLG